MDRVFGVVIFDLLSLPRNEQMTFQVLEKGKAFE
jgi:hypothetical protein